jgi:superfamily I DNA/RNA helicase
VTQRRVLTLGSPGCGKTESLLATMEAALESGTPPERIAFVSFTRAAVREAKERATKKFGIDPDRLPWMRTVHSLAFRQLGLRRSDVLGRSDLERLSDIVGEELTGHDDLDAPTIGDRGDALLFLDQAARSRVVPLEEEWERHGATVDWRRLELFVAAYAAFREDLDRLDFTDMLERYARPGSCGEPAPVDVAIVDEAQDLTPLGWACVERAFAGARELYVAGDDDQTLYNWAGADAEALLAFRGERRVLGFSHRLPRAVHALALEVVSKIERRNVKDFRPRDAAGTVEWLTDPDRADLSSGEWLLMGRTRRQLSELAAIARDQGCHYSVMGTAAAPAPVVRLILSWESLRRGSSIDADDVERLRADGALPKGTPLEVPHANAGYLGVDRGALPPWHDALKGIAPADVDYLRACLRRGEKLAKPPRVRISTVHGAKGAEAEKVLLLTDVTGKVWRSMETDLDAELRVAYVGVTRAREELHMVAARTRYAWDL